MCVTTISIQLFTGGASWCNEARKVTKIEKREIKPILLADVVLWLYAYNYTQDTKELPCFISQCRRT